MKSPKGWISSRKPLLRWTSPKGATTYDVRIYKGRKLLRKKTGMTKTSWRFSSRLPRKASLKWKVRARNVAGYGPWSNSLKFRVR